MSFDTDTKSCIGLFAGMPALWQMDQNFEACNLNVGIKKPEIGATTKLNGAHLFQIQNH